MMPTGLAIASILVMAAVTFLTRSISFFIFDRKEGAPKVILYLGRVLPAAIIAMLIIFCVKDISFTNIGKWLPQIIAIAVVVVLQLWKRNTLISVFGGTILYMILIQAVFK